MTRRSLCVAIAAAVFGAGSAVGVLTQQPPVPVSAPNPAAAEVSTFAAKKPSASKAVGYLAKHTPKKWSNASAALTTGLGLAAATCRQDKALRTTTSYLTGKARSYAGQDPYAAGRLAIFAKAVRAHPRAFGGVDLAQVILDNTQPNGQIGTASFFPWGQALAMIGLARAGVASNQATVDYLLAQQHANGSWGWSTTNASADPDFTAIALIALSSKTIGTKAAAQPSVTAAVAKAKAWLAGTQQRAGYWKNYSPVDTTSLVGSALKLHGVNTSKALSWLAKVQLKNGGFANSLTGKKADQMATAEALYLAGGKSLVTLSAPTKKCS